MFEHEYENPMVLGDYGEEDSPDKQVACPRCGRVWNGYNYEDSTEWDCSDDAYSSAFTYPVRGGICRVCAWEKKTSDQTRAYVKERNLEVSVLEYFLCNHAARGIDHRDNAKMLFNILAETDDEPTREWLDALISDFIFDEAKFDFVDWIMEGGASRVCTGNSSK